MAAKNHQHVIPGVFLRSFADPVPPIEHPKGTPFAPRIWLVPKNLVDPAKPKSPVSAFKKRRFYTLRDDDPSSPRIETALGLVETRFGAALPVLLKPEHVPDDALAHAVLFVAVLRSRLEAELVHWQKQWANLECMHRRVERFYTDREDVSDSVFWMGGETAKRLLFSNAEVYCSMMGPHAWLLRNEGPLTFVSSDMPVLYSFLHPDQLETLQFPGRVIRYCGVRSRRDYFVYAALAPRVALVASPLLCAPPTGRCWVTENPVHVLQLNEAMRQQAKEVLVSSTSDPYGVFRRAVVERDREGVLLEGDACRLIAELYTDTDRFRVECDEVTHEDGRSPLHGRIRLRARHLSAVRGLTVGMRIVELTVRDDGRIVSRKRGARVVAVGLDTVIESEPTS